MIPRVYCGTFEPEIHWREADLAKLPSLPSGNPSRIIEAMDEMMFVFCNPEDRLLSLRQMNNAHADYLNEIGFRFVRNRFDLYRDDNGEAHEGEQIAPNIFQCIRDHQVSGDLIAFFPRGAQLEPFAVLPGATEVAKHYGLTTAFPSQDVICRVNTKTYSLQMRDRLGIRNVGAVVEDVASLLQMGATFLHEGSFLIKDDYGVSGKGNQIVNTDRTLQRIAKYLSGQSMNGKRIRFVLEPYLQKQVDFSCQFRITEDGSVALISVQQLVNTGLAFGASCSPHPEFLEKIYRLGYFLLIQQIGLGMYADGYYGDVCVDSMLLQNGELVPLVEINARKSMSLIKNAVDDFLGQGRTGCLTFVTALNCGGVDFSCFLERLQKEHLLFETGRDLGILPLTSGTMFSSQMSGATNPFRGRLYLALVCDKEDQRTGLLTALNGVMEQAGLHVKH